ncbi:hypothetical protein HIM_12483 [Hirsutella minnesotensis 3608]|uniref:PNPLA domain-containing protein n=1 Tax=Hirsutella minnesotensis 3608 TaxID=1043627 RepID=A0A0F7ZQM6_9HYPO|nr:hypothetical protein HIM_12483 [Hirsutella minnesotensis 3608]
MSNCKHTDWLRLWRSGGATNLEITERPRCLLKDVSKPDHVRPSLLVLLGNRSKQIAATRLGIADARRCKARSHGEMHLFVASARGRTDKPVIVSDGDVPLHNRLPFCPRSSRCHERRTRALAEGFGGRRAVDLADAIIHRTMLPLADVVCLFAQDIGGIDVALQRLQSWFGRGQPSSMPQIRPRVLLVVGEDEHHIAQLRLDDIVKRSPNAYVADKCTDVVIVSLPDKSSRVMRQHVIVSLPDKSSRVTRQHGAGGKVGWHQFRNCIFASLDIARKRRQESSSLFSARHFSEFLCHAIDSAIDPAWTPLDVIRISRVSNPIATDLSFHVGNVVGLCKTVTQVKNVAIPLIASSLILDSYPPYMHLFHPNDVFDRLYEDACANVGHVTFTNDDGPSQTHIDLRGLLREEMAVRFENLNQNQSAAEAHRSLIVHLQPELQHLSSEDTCLCCIHRRPQTGLRCKHSLCHVCVDIFYRPIGCDERLLHVDECLLCGMQMSGVRIQQLPKTAAVRVLSFDGGGIRGVAEIESLIGLEEKVGLPMSVIRNFDLCFATSCGAGIMVRLCDGWDVRSCREHFRKTARCAFKPRLLRRFLRSFPCLQKLFLAFSVLLTDSKYPTENLDGLLRQEFGSTRSIMDFSKANELGIMFGVTLTTCGQSDAVIASNYNGIGNARTSPDYGVLMPEKGLRKIPLWEIMRCAVAAPLYEIPMVCGKHDLADFPSYFPQREIEGVGTFQDGGLTFFNNPAAIAMDEASVVFPSQGEPSVVVSLGTGSSQPA